MLVHLFCDFLKFFLKKTGFVKAVGLIGLRVVGFRVRLGLLGCGGAGA